MRGIGSSIGSRRNDPNVFVAEVSVDADIQDCVAWMISKSSRQRTQSFFDKEGGARRIEKIISSRRRETTNVVFEKHRITLALLERREVVESVWSSSEDNCMYTVLDQSKDVGKGLLRRVSDRIKSYSKVSETKFSVAPQTEDGSPPLTMIAMKFTLGNSFGSPQEEQALLDATRHLSELRTFFDKSIEIDRRRRKDFCDIVKMSNEVYSASETNILDCGMKMFSHFEGQGARAVVMTPPTTKGKMDKMKGDRRAWGWSSATVRECSVEVLAFIWDFKKRASLFEDDLERELDDSPNDHNQLSYIKKRSPKIIDDRDFLSRAIWRAVGSSKFELVSAPEENAHRPIRHGVVRATYPSAWTLVGLEGKETLTRVEYATHPDWCGDYSLTLLTNFYIKSNLARVTELQDSFQRLRPLDMYDEKDGAAVGEAFTIKTKDEKHIMKGERKNQIRVANVAKSHVAIGDF
jgi:hypothetical protein